ncbi:hypothetical protein BC940DRAFT_316501 [Gongronella butleri]|nr:hypothetical protein BC940DRAFT_316501 [Gongronella butleri]
MVFDTLGRSNKRIRSDYYWDEFSFDQEDLFSHWSPSVVAERSPAASSLPHPLAAVAASPSEARTTSNSTIVTTIAPSPATYDTILCGLLPKAYDAKPLSYRQQVQSPVQESPKSRDPPLNQNETQNDGFVATSPLSQASDVPTLALSPVPSPSTLHVPMPALANPFSSLHTTTQLDVETLHTLLSKFQLSYTSTGIHMETNITSASEFRTLLDAFAQMSVVAPPAAVQETCKRNSVVLYRNKSCKSAPINVFRPVGLLGNTSHPTHHHSVMTSRQVADLCVHVYFSCWVRCLPVLDRHEFMQWYVNEPHPEDSLIVNAICCLEFNHVIARHCIPELRAFQHDPDMVFDQEEFFFQRARDALAQSFDTPDRYTVVALSLLCARTEPSRRQHYGGLAVSLLQQLEIFPRMSSPPSSSSSSSNASRRSSVISTSSAASMASASTGTTSSTKSIDIMQPPDTVDDASYVQEMDTRLWWFIWQIDFALWTAGLPKLTPLLRRPNQRYDQVDLPRVFPQDPPEMHAAISIQAHNLALWRIQVDITPLYEQDSELTSEQLAEFDFRLMDFYHRLPDAFKFGTNGTEPRSTELDLARVRIQIEYNATRLILHRLFIPDVGDDRPSESAIASLNMCIRVALDQLDVLQLCSQPPLDCAFDRDELGRVARILSMALDIHRTVRHPERIMQGLNGNADLLEAGLDRTLQVLKATPDRSCGLKAWVDMANFVQMELQRHRLHSSSSSNTIHKTNLGSDPLVLHSPASSLSSSSSVAAPPTTTTTFAHWHKQPPHQLPKKKANDASDNPTSTTTTMTLQQQRGKQPLTGLSSPSPSIISFASPSTPSTMASSRSRRKSSAMGGSAAQGSSSSSSPIQQTTTTTTSTRQPHASIPPTRRPSARSSQFSHQTFVQAMGTRIEDKNQPRFRYFNPRTLNEFLFIDESR